MCRTNINDFKEGHQLHTEQLHTTEQIINLIKITVNSAYVESDGMKKNNFDFNRENSTYEGLKIIEYKEKRT